MKKFDIYDLLISETGGFPMDGIDDVLINQHEDELLELKYKIGILPRKEKFNLILQDDTDHFQDEVICDLFPYYGDRSASLMMEAHTRGAVILQSGEYRELKKIQNELHEKDYKVIINKIEMNDK